MKHISGLFYHYIPIEHMYDDLQDSEISVEIKKI